MKTTTTVGQDNKNKHLGPARFTRSQKTILEKG